MTSHRILVASVLTLAAALSPFAGCKSGEAPALSTSTPAENTPTPIPEVPVCHYCIPVTADNFNRAESDLYFSESAKMGGFGKLRHNREVMSIDKQAVIRANRDTMYSAGVFDLDAGPVTVTMPDAGKRFMSMLLIDEDQYAPAVFYGAGPHTITKKQIGTRYVMVGIRTFVDPANESCRCSANVRIICGQGCLSSPGCK